MQCVGCGQHVTGSFCSYAHRQIPCSVSFSTAFVLLAQLLLASLRWALWTLEGWSQGTRKIRKAFVTTNRIRGLCPWWRIERNIQYHCTAIGVLQVCNNHATKCYKGVGLKGPQRSNNIQQVLLWHSILQIHFKSMRLIWICSRLSPWWKEPRIWNCYSYIPSAASGNPSPPWVWSCRT